MNSEELAMPNMRCRDFIKLQKRNFEETLQEPNEHLGCGRGRDGL